jgi:hypothetical protein
MSEFIIGIGRCSKYLIFILGTVIFKTLNNFIFNNQINPKSQSGIFGFEPVLSNHIYIQNLYKYISYIIGGCIFEYVLTKKSQTKKENISDTKSSEENLSHQATMLIYNEQDEDDKKKNYEIIVVCLSYCISYEIISLLYLFKFDRIEIWTLEILFVLYFMKKYFKIKIYNFKKLALVIILVPITILLIISTVLPYSYHELPEEKSEDLNAYEEIEAITGSKTYFIPISLLFIAMTIFLSYSRVKSKVLMDLRYLSPYLIVFYIGIFGSILIFIMLVLISIFKCSDGIADFCMIKDLNDEKILYIDNAIIYFRELGESGKRMYIEIFLVIPFYLIIKFFEFTCEILVIYYFNPNYVLVRDNLYYGIIRLIFIIVNNKTFEQDISLTQFIILETSEVLSIFAYGIYLEIIELRFCKLDRYLKRNIIKRSEKEKRLKSMSVNDSNDNKLMTSMSSEYYEEGNSDLEMSH